MTITPHSITTEGENSFQLLLPLLTNPPNWSHHLKLNSPLAHPWDLHHQLETTGSLILLATDGGAGKGRGYFGWVIASDHQLLWEGTGVIPSHSSQINSLRPEATSRLAVLQFLKDYVSSHKTNISSRISHIVDNNSHVSRMLSYNQGARRSLKSVSRSDMDVQLEIESTLDEMYRTHHTTITTSHVKGHSDKRIGPPTWEEFLNIHADALATSSSNLCWS